MEKPKIIFLTRKKPESIFLSKKLELNKDINFIATVTENDTKGKIKLVFFKLKKLIKKQNYFKFIIFILDLPFQLINDYFNKALFRKKWNFKNYKELAFFNEYKVEDLNSSKAQNVIKDLNPDLILVFGTGILKKETFSIPKKGSINIHTGITPNYRGSKSEFWALYNNQPYLVGYTIHCIDEGIDTGKVIFQKKIKVDIKDNPFSLRAKNIEDLATNIGDIMIKHINNKNYSIKKAIALESRLYSTPYFFDYVSLYLRNKFKNLIKFSKK